MEKSYKLALIEWVDAQSSSDWIFEHDLEEEITEQDIPTREVGWIIHESPERIIICSQVIGSEKFGNRTVIPTSMVKKIDYL